MDDKKCPICGFTIIGRSDKVFCTDLCRNKHNNLIKKNANLLVKEINKTLLKNMLILESFISSGQQNLSKTEFKEKGFNFTYFTNIKPHPDGSQIFYCYKYGYRAVGNDHYELFSSVKNTNP